MTVDLPYRVLRTHNCSCGFRNEFFEALVRPGEIEPDVDLDELEPCPGCRKLVAGSAILRLPLRIDIGQAAGG